MSSIYSVTGGSAAFRPGRVHQTDVRSRKKGEVDGNRFDQVALSVGPTGSDRRRLNVVANLSKEVRSAVTTGDIQELTRQVSAGEYQSDAAEIARCMLLMQREEP